MPQVFSKSKRPRYILGLVIAAGIAVAVLAAWAWYVNYRDMALKKQEAVVLSQAQSLDFHRQFSQEQQALTVYINMNPPAQDQYQPLVQLGVMALEENQPQQSLKWYKQAESVNGKDEISDVVGLTTVYQMLGNKPEAISYLRKAVALIKDAGGNEDNSDIPTYDEELKSLGATP
jgi:tetratricopeptide (TPR) repeat protein